MHTVVEIDRSALLQNVEVYRKLAPRSAFMAVVKSNAYGHGLQEVVQVLRGSVDWFGVNSVLEAMEVRKIDPQTPILIMGVFSEVEIKQVQEIQAGGSGDVRSDHPLEPEPHLQNPEGFSGIHFVVSTIEQIQRLQSLIPGAPFHLKVDTGMSRLGHTPEEIQPVFDFLNDHPELPLRGLMTHFANVEDVSDQSYGRHQIDQFQKAISLSREALPDRSLIIHAAASAAAMILPESRLDMIRVGISLYGFWPSRTTRLSLLSMTGRIPELKPVLRWKTRIVHIKEVPGGTSVGYGCTYKTQATTKVAVLPVGYFEGYSRAYSNRASVVIRNKRARVLGRVCMNMTMVDVTHIPDAHPGDEVLLIGQSSGETVAAEELADLMSSIHYEVVTIIQKDLPRVLVDG